MKLHDLQPADGSRRPRVRVGRGIAAGKGKTAGRGTKGQKARAGGSIPAWFEGGQTPLHQRIPKLRGFRNPFRIEYEVVNVGRISAYAEADRFLPAELEDGKKGAKAPITVNQEILHAAGLVTSLAKPLKILGYGDVTVPLFIVADAFSRSAVAKIEAVGGTAQPLEVPSEPLAALGVQVVDVVEAVHVDVAPGKRSRTPKPQGAASRPKAGAASEPRPKAGAAPEPRTTVTPAPAEPETVEPEAAVEPSDEAPSVPDADA
jgi:large subunit ribosomal protein L15